MLRLTCLNCKNDVVVNPYLYEPRIITSEEFLTHERTYTAKVRGEATCPTCGNHIYETFTCPIYTKDIIDIALRRETHV
jgi:hypothetical protein